jgi:hypothetical protein
VGLGKWDWASGTGQVGLGKWDWASGTGQVGLGKWDCSLGAATAGTRRASESCCRCHWLLYRIVPQSPSSVPYTRGPPKYHRAPYGAPIFHPCLPDSGDSLTSERSSQLQAPLTDSVAENKQRYG